MKILIVGSKGNMGRRYVAICKYLGQEVLRCDLHNEKEIYDNAEFKADRCIIATPIDSHIKWCEWCVKHSIPFLCEKPISKDVSEIRKLKELCDQAKIDGRMVSNWRFLIPGTVATRVGKIFLDYYNTGKDGFWDLIQPVYLCDEFVFYNTSAIYTCTFGNITITPYNFDISYATMIMGWIGNQELLFSLDDAIKATEKIIAWGKENWHDCK